MKSLKGAAKAFVESVLEGLRCLVEKSLPTSKSYSLAVIAYFLL